MARQITEIKKGDRVYFLDSEGPIGDNQEPSLLTLDTTEEPSEQRPGILGGVLSSTKDIKVRTGGGFLTLSVPKGGRGDKNKPTKAIVAEAMLETTDGKRRYGLATAEWPIACDLAKAFTFGVRALAFDLRKMRARAHNLLGIDDYISPVILGDHSL